MYEIQNQGECKHGKNNVAIIGAGWYGCYIAEYLLDNFEHSNMTITMIDKNDEMFSGSSYNNQNRLHLGFHYPRCSITHDKCKKYFNRFIEQYGSLVEDIDRNFYAIADDSKIIFSDFVKLYDEFDLIKNDFLTNIDSDLIKTNEKYINFMKTKEYFITKFSGKVSFMNNYTVTKMINENGAVIINDEITYDKVFNCTYNQFQRTGGVFYEKCLTLIYKKIGEIPFDCLTIMDGNYSSIFKYYDNSAGHSDDNSAGHSDDNSAGHNDDNSAGHSDGDILYTLTNVQHTPLIISPDFNEVNHYNDSTTT